MEIWEICLEVLGNLYICVQICFIILGYFSGNLGNLLTFGNLTENLGGGARTFSRIFTKNIEFFPLLSWNFKECIFRNLIRNFTWNLL